MSGWQERVDSGTDPQVLLEHVARYRFTSRLATTAGTWIDLGCGNGLPAELAFGERSRARHVLLVDRDADALIAAAERFAGDGTETAAYDLGSDKDLAELEARVRALVGDGDGCVTCFELIEHLDGFVPLLGLLTRLAAETRTTVVASVPNDAYWALHNPFHQTVWGGEAFEEFRRLLPAEAVVVHQLAVHGSLLEPQDREHTPAEQVKLPVRAGLVPTHYLIAFGMRRHELRREALIEPLDLQERRAWERQREADLAWMRQHEMDRDYEVSQLRQELDALRAAWSRDPAITEAREEADT